MALLVASETSSPELAGPLAREGYSIETCLLRDALSAANGAVQAVLLDCGRSVEKGLSLLRALKTGRPAIPVIFFTDISSEDIIVGAFRSGAGDYFKKPVNIIELKGALHNLLSMRNRAPSFIREPHPFIPSREGTGEGGLPPHILRAVSHLEINFSGDICLQRLAREAGISKHYLCRAFKRHMGLTPMRFLARLRVERAKELLKTGTLSVSTVAAEVGFNDLGSFIKQFKKLSGFTPGEFRKKTASEESLRLF
ncbi:MAG: helix-turn-helix domain-containing protein [Nitrospiraceae bacterium]|nr:helix-turn-helix domain-containing protein [Nitrospiraceae bacterium]